MTEVELPTEYKSQPYCRWCYNTGKETIYRHDLEEFDKVDCDHCDLGQRGDKLL